MKKVRQKAQNVARYSVVGVSATAVEWILFFILNQLMSLQYIPAFLVASVFSILSSWAIGRFLMFHGTGNIRKELGKIYLSGFTAMSFNLLLMWIMVGKMGLHEMAAKPIATLLVFLWNYVIVTKVIYKGKLKSRMGERDRDEKRPESPE